MEEDKSRGDIIAPRRHKVGHLRCVHVGCCWCACKYAVMYNVSWELTGRHGSGDGVLSYTPGGKFTFYRKGNITARIIIIM